MEAPPLINAPSKYAQSKALKNRAKIYKGKLDFSDRFSVNRIRNLAKSGIEIEFFAFRCQPVGSTILKVALFKGIFVYFDLIQIKIFQSNHSNFEPKAKNVHFCTCRHKRVKSLKVLIFNLSLI